LQQLSLKFIILKKVRISEDKKNNGFTGSIRSDWGLPLLNPLNHKPNKQSKTKLRAGIGKISMIHARAGL
jgi:hypothetical protein